VGQRIAILRRRIEGLAQKKAVVERLGFQVHRALQMRDRLRGVVGEPQRNTQVIVRGREFRIQGEGLFEFTHSLVALPHDGEQEADLVVNARGLRLGCQRFPPDCQRARRISPSASGGRSCLDIA
jgi:hypothetical protein